MLGVSSKQKMFARAALLEKLLNISPQIPVATAKLLGKWISRIQSVESTAMMNGRDATISEIGDAF
jgi:hypothetical protein